MGGTMRLEFEDDDLRRLAFDSSHHTRRWSPAVTRSFRKVIGLIRSATSDRDLRALKGLRLEKLRGFTDGRHSVRINAQYRLIIRFDTVDDKRIVIAIDALDYH